jgi:hypothetical protein
MGKAMEVINARVVNQVALTAATFSTGDSGTVKAFNPATKAWLCEMWGLEATAGVVRIRSPRMHDNVQNLRFTMIAADSRPLLGDVLNQPLYPQDVLIVEESGGGAETDGVAYLNYYQDLPGTDARLFRWEEIAPRVRNVLTVEVSTTTSATPMDYGGAVAINSLFSTLKANVDYAVLGFVSNVNVCSIGLRGPDTGNLRVGGPGTNQRTETRDWFRLMSLWNDLPMIPVINAANQGATLVDATHTTGSTTVVIDFSLAELAPA